MFDRITNVAAPEPTPLPTPPPKPADPEPPSDLAAFAREVRLAYVSAVENGDDDSGLLVRAMVRLSDALTARILNDGRPGSED